MDLRVMDGTCRGLVVEALSHSRDQRMRREQSPGVFRRRNSNVTGRFDRPAVHRPAHRRATAGRGWSRRGSGTAVVGWARERAVEQSRHPRWGARWVRGRPRRRPPRCRGHGGRARRARRRGGAHRLRAEQDADLHRRLHERLRDRPRPRRAPRGRRGRRGRGCRRRPARGQPPGARPRRRAERRHRHPAGGGRCARARRPGRAHLAHDGAGRDRRRGGGARDRRGARRHRCHPAGHGHRTPRRRAHPHLAADLRPRRPARAARRRRVGRHRAPSWPRPTSGWARRSCSSPRATACCPARTPTPPRSSRTSSPSAAWRCSVGRGWRPSSAPPTASLVRLEDGREVAGSHALLAVGSVPHTSGIGLEEVGVELTASGHVAVDRVSRTSVRGVYAAGDCTGVLPLASVAAMQGRIAMSHALGDAVAPLNLRVVSRQHLHRPRDRHGRGVAEGRRRRGRRRRGADAAAARATRGRRCSASPTAS